MFRFSPASVFSLAASLSLLATVGCGIGPTTMPVDTLAVPHGIVHGGPNPITGATVTLYSTVTSPASTYGSAGLVLATAITDDSGNFTFASRLPCPGPNEQAYLVTQGGNPGGATGTTNPNYALMAALGNCSDLSSSTYIWISEASTVAAAYALSNFTTVTRTGPLLTVNVGAPANAAAATGSCSNVNSVVSSCTTAGLRHAFQNAANLVNAVGSISALPDGRAFAASPQAAGSIAPQRVINSLANSIQACVNSPGGTAGDSSPCGALFTATTPGSGVSPDNTVDALLQLAKNPTLHTATIFNLAAPQSFFYPTLQAAPTDYSLAILYPPASIGATVNPPINYEPEYTKATQFALDSNDTVYVSFDSQTTNNGLHASSPGAIASNGALLYAANLNAYTYSGYATGMATDTLGNVWQTYYSLSAQGSIIKRFTSATGALLSSTDPTSNPQPYGLAVDHANNVWYALDPRSSSAGGLGELVQANNYTAATFAHTPSLTSGLSLLAIDQNQNVWGSSNYSPSVFPNTGTIAAPAYAGSAISVPNYSSPNGYAQPAVDNAGHVWVGTQIGIDELTPTYTGAAVTAILRTSHLQSSGFNGAAVDGNNGVWASSSSSFSINHFNVTPRFNLSPCTISTTAGTCDTLTAGNQVAIDSTGSIWVNAGSLIQIIGSASPAWPQLSYGHPGVKPN